MASPSRTDTPAHPVPKLHPSWTRLIAAALLLFDHIGPKGA